MSGQRVDVKVVMLGKEYVGKTSLVERYVHDRFLVGPYQNTIGAAFVAKVMSVGDRTVTLGIWDTAGSERYEAMSRIYYRGAKAAIVCYDLTDSSSFERAKFWVKELRSLEEGCQIYLCGTKSDLLEEDRGVDVWTSMTSRTMQTISKLSSLKHPARQARVWTSSSRKWQRITSVWLPSR